MANFQVKSNYELKDVDEKTGIVTGYCSIFNNIDSDGDMILPGAFKKSLEERGCGSVKPRIKHLWMHDSWQPIAIPKALREDEKGLYFESMFGKDRFSQDKLQQHIDGIITELSIGFNTVRREDVQDIEGKISHKKLIELKLWEYSSVTWGANSLTNVISAKGEEEDIMANLNRRLEALSRAVKNGKYSEEAAESFEVEITKIQAIISSLKVITAPVIETTHEDDAPNTKAVMESILSILKNHNNG